MRTIKIGDEECKLISGADELRYSRMVMFQQYIAGVFEGVDKTSFLMHWEKAMSYWDKGQFFRGIKALENYKISIELSEMKLDPLGICFALICLEDGEDQASHKEDYLVEKLKRWNEKGLTAGTVEKEVVNFMKASPVRFSPQIQMWEMLKQI